MNSRAPRHRRHLVDPANPIPLASANFCCLPPSFHNAPARTMAPKVVAFTEAIADTAVRFQLTLLRDSVLVWVQQFDPAASSSAAATMPTLAVATPAIAGCDGLPATTSLLRVAAAHSESERFASRIAKRCGITVYASINLGDTADVAADLVFGRIINRLQELGMSAAKKTTKNTTTN